MADRVAAVSDPGVGGLQEIDGLAINQFRRPLDLGLGDTDTKPMIKGILAFWGVILLPWLPFSMLSGMAFDGGDKWQAYVFVSSVWSFPFCVYAGFHFRKTRPVLVLLPLLTFAVIWVSGA